MGIMRQDIRHTITSLSRDQGDCIPVEALEEAVESILSGLSGEISGADLLLHQEIRSLADYIAAARSEISAIRPGASEAEHLQIVNDELDAIVSHTETATGSILDAAEKLEALCPSLEAASAAVINDQVTAIYEACNFQDITGQRITRVVSALKHVEEKIIALSRILGDGGDGVGDGGEDGGENVPRPVASAAPAGSAKPPPTDADLLNGPQMPDEAQSQDQIDALLASFDQGR